jgi:hypothetical protein
MKCPTSNKTLHRDGPQINSADRPMKGLDHPADHRADVARILSAKAENRPANV